MENDYRNYYEKILYPIQDGVLKLFADARLPFHLTGGTALSRFYLNHRYSDDLDFFVNNYENFPLLRDRTLQLIAESSHLGLCIEKSTVVLRDYSASFYLTSTNHQDDIRLKIDLVNDVEYRLGQPILAGNSILVDNWENILTNKISALLRFAARDYADIWAIAHQYAFSWAEIMEAARQKDVGIDATVIASIIRDMPLNELEKVKWVQRPDKDAVKADLIQIADDILRGADNSLSA